MSENTEENLEEAGPSTSEAKADDMTTSQEKTDKMVKRSGKRGRRPAKIDSKAKLERSRQSARECRARKKLRYQYLEEMVSSRERAIYSLREELETIKQWCIQIDKGTVPPEAGPYFEAEQERKALLKKMQKKRRKSSQSMSPGGARADAESDSSGTSFTDSSDSDVEIVEGHTYLITDKQRSMRNTKNIGGSTNKDQNRSQSPKPVTESVYVEVSEMGRAKESQAAEGTCSASPRRRSPVIIKLSSPTKPTVLDKCISDVQMTLPSGLVLVPTPATPSTSLVHKISIQPRIKVDNGNTIGLHTSTAVNPHATTVTSSNLPSSSHNDSQPQGQKMPKIRSDLTFDSLLLEDSSPDVEDKNNFTH